MLSEQTWKRGMASFFLWSKSDSMGRQSVRLRIERAAEYRTKTSSNGRDAPSVQQVGHG